MALGLNTYQFLICWLKYQMLICRRVFATVRCCCFFKRSLQRQKGVFHRQCWRRVEKGTCSKGDAGEETGTLTGHLRFRRQPKIKTAPHTRRLQQTGTWHGQGTQYSGNEWTEKATSSGPTFLVLLFYSVVVFPVLGSIKGLGTSWSEFRGEGTLSELPGASAEERRSEFAAFVAPGELSQDSWPTRASLLKPQNMALEQEPLQEMDLLPCPLSL